MLLQTETFFFTFQRIVFRPLFTGRPRGKVANLSKNLKMQKMSLCNILLERRINIRNVKNILFVSNITLEHLIVLIYDLLSKRVGRSKV
jgi:hypothetical protein